MKHILLWVQPKTDPVMPLKQLDTELRPLFAGVSPGVRRSRDPSLSAVRLFGAANETIVSEKLCQLGYSIVDREERNITPLTDTPTALRKGSIRAIKRKTKPRSQ